MENNATSTKPARGRDRHSPANVRPEDYTYHGIWEPLEPVGHETAMMVALGGPGAAERFRAMREAQIAAHEALVREIADAGYKGNFDAKRTCDHCGAYFKYGSIFRHEPTGELIVVGWICSEETFDVPDRAALDQKRARERAAAGREALKRAEALQAWIDEDPTRQTDVIDWMLAHPEDGFYQDLLAKMRKYGPLSERQEAAVRKGPEREAKRLAALAADAAAGPVPEGRLVLEGEVLSTKWQDSDYGGSLKMVVRLDNGSRVWGSVPSSMQAMEQPLDRGDRVQFTATVEASRDDASFGYYKRPSKASRLSGTTVSDDVSGLDMAGCVEARRVMAGGEADPTWSASPVAEVDA